jgi:hypothetical protein
MGGIIARDSSSILLEYMACGTPAVTPSNHFSIEVTRNGEFATLYDQTSPLSIAGALLSTLEGLKIARRKAKSAYKHIRSYYTAASARRVILHAYAELLPPSAGSEADHFYDSGPRYKTETISWQGKRTSSTGVGSSIPVSPDGVNDAHSGLVTYKPGTGRSDTSEAISIDVEEIEFEATGTLLGLSIDTNEPGTDPLIHQP